MDNKQLFNKLVEKKFLDQKKADDILKSVKLSGKSVEGILFDQKIVGGEDIAKIKSEVLDVPYKKINPKNIPEDVLDLIPYETSKTYRVIPIEKREGMLIVGMENPKDSQAQNALKFIVKKIGLSLGVYVVSSFTLRAVWNRYKPYESEIKAAVRQVSGIEEEDEDIIGLEEQMKQSQDAPIIKIVASTLKQAVDAKASDIHFEPQRDRLRIRFRIDGDLQQVAELPVKLSKSLISRVKVLAQLKLDETRIPQDGRFRTVVFGKNIDFRVSTFPIPSGEKVAIRVLDPTAGVKSIEELGLQTYNMETLKEAINDPYGMILITGPTGSGKSTTLYAAMNKLNTETVNVVTLEDPVEYFMSGLNQSQVMPEIGYSFASGLRQILRQDPDIIMVGEIRDKETAGLAVNAALTGHLMLSTLHTNNSIGVVPRLINLGVPSFLLSPSLNIIIAQRLVSKLCPNCKKKVKASDKMQQTIKKEIEDMPDSVRDDIKSKYKEPYYIYKPEQNKDCEICQGKGTSGRVAIFEVFKNTKELESIIASGFSEDKLWAEAKRQGMVTLRQDGIIKALKGDVLLGETLRETEAE